MKLRYSLQELQDLFQCSRQTIGRMEKDGRLHRLYGVPGVFYRSSDVLALCEYKEPEHGPLEWEQVQNELKQLREENKTLRKRLENVLIAASGGETV